MNTFRPNCKLVHPLYEPALCSSSRKPRKILQTPSKSSAAARRFPELPGWAEPSRCSHRYFPGARSPAQCAALPARPQFIGEILFCGGRGSRPAPDNLSVFPADPRLRHGGGSRGPRPRIRARRSEPYAVPASFIGRAIG